VKHKERPVKRISPQENTPELLSKPEISVSQICILIFHIVIKVAHCIIFDKVMKLGNKKLHMMLHKSFGDYNSKTSVYIGLINPFCMETDIVEELNLVLRDDRVKKEKERQDQTPIVQKNFILSCCVFYDPVTSRPKQFAFVDFSTEEAADLCIKAWNNKSMKKFPNRLVATYYDA
jgi:RNA recognition motif-containing protein